jgi:hypothetical protein
MAEVTVLTRMCLYAAALVFLGCGGDAPPTAPDGTPIRAELLGMNIDPQNPTANPPVSELQRLGVTRVRFTFRAGTDLGAAFASYDPILAGYAGAGIAVLLILDSETLGPPDLPVNLAGSAWDSYVSDFASRAQTIAQHYQQQVEAYEIWNEEDLDDSLPGRHIEPGPYAALLNATYDAIHAVTGTQVLVGGLASGQTSYLDGMGDFRADVIATHPYLHWPGPGVPSGWYSMSDHLNAYGAYWKPIWFTEWGTNDSSLQVSLLQQFFETTSVTDRVGRAFFFAWSDTQDADVGYGITTDGVHYKEALENAYAAAAQSSIAPCVAIGGLGVIHGVVRDRTTGTPIGSSGAGITVYSAGQQSPVAPNGSYCIELVAPGDYGIAAVNNWGATSLYSTWSSTVNVQPGMLTSFDIDLGASAPPTGGGTGSVAGTVYDVTTGAPIHPNDPDRPAGITVYCGGAQTQIKDDGTYQIDGLAENAYGISAVNNYNEPDLYQTTSWSVTILAGQTTTQDLYLEPN